MSWEVSPLKAMIAAGPSQSRWVCDAKSSRLNAAQLKIWLIKTSEKRGSATVKRAAARQWEAQQRDSEKRSSAAVRSAVARQTVNYPVIKYHSEFLHLERFLERNLKEKTTKD